MMKIAVLMTCFNRVQTTLLCLRKLHAQKLPEGYALDVWLVDDASPDRTGDKVLDWFHSLSPNAAFNLYLIRGSGSLFWCRGMRKAWDCATSACEYDYYLLLNDDVVLLPDAVAGALADHAAVVRECEGTISGCLTDGAVSTVVAYGIGMENGSQCVVPDGKRVVRCNGNTGGNFLLVPKTVYQAVGPICGYYHHGYGDFDYGLQVRKHGFATYAASRIVGSCLVGQSRAIDLTVVRLMKRIGLLFSAKGFRLDDVFVFRYRNYGLLRAVISVGHVFLHVLCPKMVK